MFTKVLAILHESSCLADHWYTYIDLCMPLQMLMKRAPTPHFGGVGSIATTVSSINFLTYVSSHTHMQLSSYLKIIKNK